MQIRLAFGALKEDTDMPRVIAATDEFTVDDWNSLPNFYVKEMDQHRDETGEVRELLIEIPDKTVLDLFAVPSVTATVVGQPEA